MCDHEDQVTLDLLAADAVVTDYRLLHGTHANLSNRSRDCVVLSFAPNWERLPPDIRGHLIQHPALPHDGEDPSSCAGLRSLLPSYSGSRRDLTLNGHAAAEFIVIGRC